MPDNVNGLPVHPLVVHAVVVLLPLAALGVVALAVRPSWRGRFGGLVLLVAALATVAIPLATSSGENLERRVGDPGRHAELGDTLIWFAVPLLVVALALYGLHRRSAAGTAADPAGTRRTSGPGAVGVVVAVLAVVVAAANLVQLYRVGDTGAKAVWGNTPAATAGHGEGDGD
ncbi:DUF2231 domain-containing protein [Micromonospora sp. NPDC048930]|uniref:DUF2231 domain-containing protein n=1 Tax=Micromonospora sp. NPDC048930 TaxID=3364261 RepID=UPI00371CF206